MTPTRLQVVAGVLRDEDGRVLVVRRGQAMAHPGCWEFPGGKVESGESLGEALSRELREELDLQIEAGNVLYSETLPVDDCVLEIHFLEGRIASGSTLALGEHDALDWVAPDQVAALKLAPGDVGFAQRMETILSSP